MIYITRKSSYKPKRQMTCKLNACTEKSTQSSTPNTQHMIIGSIIGFGLLYLVFSKRK